MPLSDQHKKQRSKNIALMVILLALIALVYAISLMRMGFGGS